MSAIRMSAGEFLQFYPKFKQGSETILDLRTKAEVERENIDNCVCLPIQQLNHDSFKTLINNTGEKQRVYLLCQSGMRADAAVRQLGMVEGVEWVVIEGGLNAIKAAGGKVNTGERTTLTLERQVRIAAGLVILAGVLLGFNVNSAFFFVSAFVGAGLVFAGITDRCGLAFVLARMPWNQ